jgi:hemolysin activation/secretion protein
MNARVVLLVVAAAAVVAAGVWGFQAGRQAIARASEEAHRKVAQAVQEAQSKAQAATAEAERQAAEEAKSSAAGGSPPVPEAKATDDAFLVKSITIDGLEEAGITPDDLGNVEIELDDRPAALGRPTERTVKISSLLQPVSPLTLYAPELARLSAAVVEQVQKRGYVGIYVDVGDTKPGGQPLSGVHRWRLHLATVTEVRVDDRRAAKQPPVNADKVREDFPLKVGDHLVKAKMDTFASALRDQIDNEVNLQLEAGEKTGDVVLTIILGPAKGP